VPDNKICLAIVKKFRPPNY